jgi:hypothetical protein
MQLRRFVVHVFFAGAAAEEEKKIIKAKSVLLFLVLILQVSTEMRFHSVK